MQHNMKVYLAGPMTGLSKKQSNEWRKKVSRAFKRFSESNAIDIWTSNPVENDKYFQAFQADVRHDFYYEKDMHDVRTSDLVLVNFEHSAGTPSIGTIAEISEARARGIPIVMVLPKDNIHNHIFITHNINFVVDNLDEAIEISIVLLTK